MIPKSSSPKGIKENSEIFDFELTDEDMGRIRRLVHGKPAICEANEAVYVKLTLLAHHFWVWKGTSCWTVPF